jgi:hypothetical protein
MTPIQPMAGHSIEFLSFPALRENTNRRIIVHTGPPDKTLSQKLSKQKGLGFSSSDRVPV